MSKLIPCWHAYHSGGLIFWVDLDERAAQICRKKPEDEIRPRFHFMKPVRGKLPKELDEAWQKYGEVCQKLNEAWQKYDGACRKYGEACRKLNEVWRKYVEAQQKYVEARQKYAPEIEALHAKECPNCVWDGTEMVWAEWLNGTDKGE